MKAALLALFFGCACTAVAVAEVRTTERISGGLPYAVFESDLPEGQRGPKFQFRLGFIIDFTYSQNHGVRVLELGPDAMGPLSSSLSGHQIAFPDKLSVAQLVNAAVQDFQGKRLKGAGRLLSPNQQIPAILASDKILSLMLEDAETAIRPPQVIVPDLIGAPEGAKEQVAAELHRVLGNGPWVVKTPRDADGRGVFLIEPAGFADFRLTPALAQEYLPSSDITSHGQTYQPTGRIYLQFMADGSKLFAYPLSVYWKFRQPVSHLSDKSAPFTGAMQFATPIDLSTVEEILTPLTHFGMQVALNMHSISRNGINPHLGQRLLNLRLFEAVAMKQHMQSNPGRLMTGPLGGVYEVVRHLVRAAEAKDQPVTQRLRETLGEKDLSSIRCFPHFL